MTTPSKIKLNVEMTCDGCFAAVKRVLRKMDNISSITNPDKNIVVIEGTNLDANLIVTKVAKTGKATRLITEPKNLVPNKFKT